MSIKSTPSVQSSRSDEHDSFKSVREDSFEMEMEDMSTLTQDEDSLFTPCSRNNKGEDDSIFSFINNLQREIQEDAVVTKEGMALAVSGKPSSLALAVKGLTKRSKRKTSDATNVTNASVFENIDSIPEEDDRKIPAVEDASAESDTSTVEPPQKRVSIAVVETDSVVTYKKK